MTISAVIISIQWGELLAPGLLLILCAATTFLGRRSLARGAMSIYMSRTAGKPPGRNILTWSPTLTEQRMILIIIFGSIVFFALGMWYVVAAVIGR